MQHIGFFGVAFSDPNCGASPGSIYTYSVWTNHSGGRGASGGSEAESGMKLRRRGFAVSPFHFLVDLFNGNLLGG